MSVEVGGFRLGGTRPAVDRSRESCSRLESSGRCCDYAFNDSYDGVRFYTSGSGYGCDDCCDTYGIDRLFQECGGSL